MILFLKLKTLPLIYQKQKLLKLGRTCKYNISLELEYFNNFASFAGHYNLKNLERDYPLPFILKYILK